VAERQIKRHDGTGKQPCTQGCGFRSVSGMHRGQGLCPYHFAVVFHGQAWADRTYLPACDCIASGNMAKPKQHGADLHAKDCAIYTGAKGPPPPQVCPECGTPLSYCTTAGERPTYCDQCDREVLTPE